MWTQIIAALAVLTLGSPAISAAQSLSWFMATP